MFVIVLMTARRKAKRALQKRRPNNKKETEMEMFEFPGASGDEGRRDSSFGVNNPMFQPRSKALELRAPSGAPPLPSRQGKWKRVWDKGEQAHYFENEEDGRFEWDLPEGEDFWEEKSSNGGKDAAKVRLSKGGSLSPPAAGLAVVMLCLTLSLSAVGDCEVEGRGATSTGREQEDLNWVLAPLLFFVIAVGLAWLAVGRARLLLGHVLSPNSASQKRSPAMARRAQPIFMSPPAYFRLVLLCLLLCLARTQGTDCAPGSQGVFEPDFSVSGCPSKCETCSNAPRCTACCSRWDWCSSGDAYCNNGGTDCYGCRSQTGCGLCAAGRYKDSTGSGSWARCPAGTYSGTHNKGSITLGRNGKLAARSPQW